MKWQNRDGVQVHREGRLRGTVDTKLKGRCPGHGGECEGRAIDKVVAGHWYGLILLVLTGNVDIEIAVIWCVTIWAPPLIGQLVLETKSKATDNLLGILHCVCFFECELATLFVSQVSCLRDLGRTDSSRHPSCWFGPCQLPG